eukprot:Skav212224  [mRNA]  locus=scaffold862:168390:171487:+ [translate_table: standard]
MKVFIISIICPQGNPFFLPVLPVFWPLPLLGLLAFSISTGSSVRSFNACSAALCSACCLVAHNSPAQARDAHSSGKAALCTVA